MQIIYNNKSRWVQTISRAEKFIYDNNSNKLRIKQFWIVQVSLMLLAWLLALHGPWFHGTLPYWHQFHACIQVAFRIDHLDDHTKKSVEDPQMETEQARNGSLEPVSTMWILRKTPRRRQETSSPSSREATGKSRGPRPRRRLQQRCMGSWRPQPEGVDPVRASGRGLPSFNAGAGVRSRRRPPLSPAPPRPSSGPSASVRCSASTCCLPSFLRPRGQHAADQARLRSQWRPPAADGTYVVRRALCRGEEELLLLKQTHCSQPYSVWRIQGTVFSFSIC